MEYKFDGDRHNQIQIGSYNFTKGVPRTWARPKDLAMLLGHPKIEMVKE